jgi:hypothetical protein
MGSRLRFTAVVVAVVALASVSAGGATGASRDAEQARATALDFLTALGNSDSKHLCALFTPAAVARIGGVDRCESAFAADEEEADFEALDTLSHAFVAARQSAAKRHGQYVTKTFTRKQLARDIERRAPQLTVKLGNGPRAAAGQLVTTVVLDTRSTGRRLVLYAESDDGSILRLSAPRKGDPSLDEVAFGIPEDPQAEPEKPDFHTSVDSILFDGTTALARSTFVVTYRGETHTYAVLLVLVPTANGYLVDDFLYSVLSEP